MRRVHVGGSRAIDRGASETAVGAWPSYFILRRTSYSLALARSYSSLSRRAASAPLRALTHMPWQGCSHSTVPHAALSPLAARTAAPHTHTPAPSSQAPGRTPTHHTQENHIFDSHHCTHALTHRLGLAISLDDQALLFFLPPFFILLSGGLRRLCRRRVGDQVRRDLRLRLQLLGHLKSRGREQGTRIISRQWPSRWRWLLLL